MSLPDAQACVLAIVECVKEYDQYFTLNRDCTGQLGFSGLQKCTVAMKMLIYDTTADDVDEYVRMAESTCNEAMVRFATAMVGVFRKDYLREPNAKDTTWLLAPGQSRGFLGRKRFLIGCPIPR